MGQISVCLAFQTILKKPNEYAFNTFYSIFIYGTQKLRSCYRFYTFKLDRTIAWQKPLKVKRKLLEKFPDSIERVNKFLFHVLQQVFLQNLTAYWKT